jgi:hypothetical protein
MARPPNRAEGSTSCGREGSSGGSSRTSPLAPTGGHSHPYRSVKCSVILGGNTARLMNLPEKPASPLNCPFECAPRDSNPEPAD